MTLDEQLVIEHKINNFLNKNYLEPEDDFLLYCHSWERLMQLVGHILSYDLSKKHYQWDSGEGSESNFESTELELTESFCNIRVNLKLDPSICFLHNSENMFLNVLNCCIDFIDAVNEK